MTPIVTPSGESLGARVGGIDLASPLSRADFAFILAALAAHGVPTKAVVSHLCADCVTTTTVVRLGKHSPPDTVTHKCAMCDTGKPAAKGMEGMTGMAPVE